MLRVTLNQLNRRKAVLEVSGRCLIFSRAGDVIAASQRLS